MTSNIALHVCNELGKVAMINDKISTQHTEDVVLRNKKKI